MTGRLSMLAVCALFTLTAHAGSVEFAQWLPWKFLSQELRKTEISHAVVREEMPLPVGEFRPVFRNLAFAIQGQMNHVEYAGGKIAISGDGSLVVSVSAVSVDQIITREVAGNILQVHVKADCGPLLIEVPAFRLSTFFEAGTELPALVDLQMNMEPGSWIVSSVQCSGISQLSREIAGQIQAFLRAPDSLSSLLLEWSAPAVDQWLKSQWPALSSGEHWENIRLGSLDEKGLMITGDLRLEGSDEVPLPVLIPESLRSDHPRLFISKEGITALMKDRLKKIIPPFYDLRSNAGFRKLMSSRLMQYLVWPELRRFHANTPFVLRTEADSLEFQLRGDTGQWTAAIAGKGALVTVVGGAPIDYLDTRLTLAMPLTMTVTEGRLTFTTGKATAKMDVSVSPLYRLLYSPDEKVPVSLISGAISSLASQRTETYVLPSVVSGDSELTLSNLQFHNNLVTMDWL